MYMKMNRTTRKKKSKFNTDLCSDKMTFNECELAILRHAVDESDKQQSEKMANSDEVIRMIQILEEFIRKKKCICYGGTAINNLLPKHAQFYNKDVEIPDYDFYTPHALEYAKELADIYYKAGFKEIEAKAGVHYGTFKVFVNFIPIADITYLNQSIFKSISKDSIKIDNIMYAPPDFLRMSMYLELSRPAGDVSRWEKVLKRLLLLNKYHPLKPQKCMNIDSFKKRTNIYYITRDTLVEQGVVFFGGYASGFYSNYADKMDKNLRIPDFDVLSEEPYKCANVLIEKLESMNYKNVKMIHRDAVGEIIPERIEIKVDSESIAYIYKPIACHNYNTIHIKDKEIKIATIDTMLSFYLAFYYSDEPHFSKDRILCMAKFLFDVEQKNRLEQKGVLKRFSIKCIGKQPTIESMRSEKMEKFNELKDKRGSKDYDMWFLQYNPKALQNRTKKNKGSSAKKEVPESKKEVLESKKEEDNGNDYLF
jgi:hypothetical protein